MSPNARLRLLGGATIEGQSGPLAALASRRHPLAILALVATAPGRMLSRGKLVGLLWPETSEEAARNRLNTYLYRIRRELGSEILLSVGDDLRLESGALRCDVWEFEDALERAEPRTAVELYAGPFMDGFRLGGSPEFEQWVDLEEARLRRLYREAMEALATVAERRGDREEAVRWWRRRAGEDPYDSRVTRRLMEALVEAGNPADALRAARAHRQRLENDFGTEPAAEILALETELRDSTGREEQAAADETRIDSAPAPERAERSLPEPTGGVSHDTESGPRAPALTGTDGPRIGGVTLAVLFLLAGAIVVGWLASRTGGESAAGTGRPSIAVLPFLNLTADPQQDYFAEGIAEELIDHLARYDGLDVAARTSAFQFEGKPQDVRQIGRRLHVDHVLEGSVRREGDRIRVAVQLIDARTGYHLWSESYDREMTGVFRVQDDISRAVAKALRVRLRLDATREDWAATRDTTNPDTYAEYLLGRHLLNQRTEKSVNDALAHFRRAVQLDPDYAPAQAQTAITYLMLSGPPAGYGDYPREISLELAKPYLDRALELAPRSPDTKGALGLSLMVAGKREEALVPLREATEANPSYMDALNWRAYDLHVLQRYAEQLQLLRQGLRRDPLNFVINERYLIVLLTHRRFDEASQLAQRFQDVDSAQGKLLLGQVADARGRLAEGTARLLDAYSADQAAASLLLREVLMQAGLYDEMGRLESWIGLTPSALGEHAAGAVDLVRQRLERDPDDSRARLELTEGYMLLGRPDEAKREFDRLWEDWGRSMSDSMTFPHLTAYAALLREAGQEERARTLLADIRAQLERRRSREAVTGLGPAGHWLTAAGLEIMEGDLDGGLDDLETAVKETPYVTAFSNVKWGSVYLERAPQFDPVREDPRFQQLQRRLAEREAEVRREILPLLCGHAYPEGKWRPSAAACEGVGVAGS